MAWGTRRRRHRITVGGDHRECSGIFGTVINRSATAQPSRSAQIRSRSPLLNEFGREHSAGEILRQDRHDVVDASDGRRPDRLKPMLMSGLTDLVRELKVVTDKFIGRDAKGLQRLGVCEIENLRQHRRDEPQLARQKILNRQPLSASLPRQLRDHTRSRRAQVDDRVAVGPVEPSAESTGTLAASRIEAGGLVAVAAHREALASDLGELARVERGHVSQ